MNLGGVACSFDTRHLRFTAKALGVAKTVEISWADVRTGLMPLNADRSPEQGVNSFMTEEGLTMVLAPEALLIPQTVKRMSDGSEMKPMSIRPKSEPTIVHMTLDSDYPEAMPSIIYFGDTPGVTVETPQSIVMPVVINASDSGAEPEPGSLYGIDFEDDPDTAKRQMLICIPEAMAGEYMIAVDSQTVDEVSMFEIIAVPQIRNLNTVLFEDMATLTWELDRSTPNVRYYLLLERLEDGVRVDEIPLFVSMGEVVDEEEAALEDSYLVDAHLVVSSSFWSELLSVSDLPCARVNCIEAFVGAVIKDTQWKNVDERTIILILTMVLVCVAVDCGRRKATEMLCI